MSETPVPSLNPKHAWRELAHKGLPKRSAAERVADFLEIYGLYDEATAREQASRCIQCPNPSCVTGCPLCNPIPEWMLLTAEGRFLEAAAVLGSATNMAEICARVCPTDRLCEGSFMNGVSEPISIGAIEQFLGEYAFAHGHADVSTAPPNGRRVAVVGSGPGGLACADELAKQGYAVTVMDSALVPGGLLVNGTPAFRVEKSIVQRRIEILQKRGVVFQLGVKLNGDLTLGQLRREFDAVFLGFDSRKARTLDVPGAELRGVIQASCRRSPQCHWSVLPSKSRASAFWSLGRGTRRWIACAPPFVTERATPPASIGATKGTCRAAGASMRMRAKRARGFGSRSRPWRF